MPLRTVRSDAPKWLAILWTADVGNKLESDEK
jgi:hypothetical protein